MTLREILTNGLLVFLFLVTPLMFAVSLYFQDKNRLIRRSAPPPESDHGKPKPAAPEHHHVAKNP